MARRMENQENESQDLAELFESDSPDHFFLEDDTPPNPTAHLDDVTQEETRSQVVIPDSPNPPEFRGDATVAVDFRPRVRSSSRRQVRMPDAPPRYEDVVISDSHRSRVRNANPSSNIVARFDPINVSSSSRPITNNKIILPVVTVGLISNLVVFGHEMASPISITFLKGLALAISLLSYSALFGYYGILYKEKRKKFVALGLHIMAAAIAFLIVFIGLKGYYR